MERQTYKGYIIDTDNLGRRYIYDTNSPFTEDADKMTIPNSMPLEDIERLIDQEIRQRQNGVLYDVDREIACFENMTQQLPYDDMITDFYYIRGMLQTLIVNKLIPYSEYYKRMKNIKSLLKSEGKEMKITELRNAKNLTQRELADLADVPIRSLQDYEQQRKDIKKASAETVYHLATALGCSMEELIN